MVGDKSTMVAMCLTCHEALDSSESADVLIPGIDNCVQCHADERVAKHMGKVSTQCVDCHQFHIPGKPSMSPSQAALDPTLMDMPFMQAFKHSVKEEAKINSPEIESPEIESNAMQGGTPNE
ncbi:MAG: hypothetical protein P1U57_04160, partial [Oleibacter sp.]|nr:hypothetical protein [Thalassolituus sp.]